MRPIWQRLRALFSQIPLSAAIWALLTIATGIALLFYRGRLTLELHIEVARLLDWVKAAHPILARIVRVAKDVTPDVSILLLAIAGLGYLMPETVKKIESSKALRRVVASVFLVVALTAIVLNEVERIEKEAKQQEVAGTLNGVASTEGEILKDILESKDMPEVERRKHILRILRDEYVRSHQNISAGILAGVEPLPSDWTNKRLRELGQSWSVTAGSSSTAVPPTPRSYVAFEGNPLFTGGSSNTEGGDFKAGDDLAFNVHFRAAGPNAITLLYNASQTVLAPDIEIATQEKIAKMFEETIKREIKNLKPTATTMTPGDRHFNTAFSVLLDESKKKTLNQSELDDLHSGRLFVFVISEIAYEDHGTTHHLRRFVFLQPPATPPGVWHFCSPFNKSD